MKRISLLAALAAPLLFAGQASADFHLMKISEVFPGGDASFVELQMYSGGQNQLGGHTITVYNAAGSGLDIPLVDVTSGQSQRTVLIGATGVASRDISADGLDGQLAGAGGAVCFETVDCVAWDSFGTLVPPAGSSVGTPETAIPAGSSLTRSIAGGCATLLENSDDTDDSAADFLLTSPPTPRSNNTAPTEVSCGGSGGAGGASGGKPETIINKGPRKQSTKTKAKFRFSSPDPVTGFECSLDGRAFKSCSSPAKYKRLKRKKHTFEVRALNATGADPSPATYKWKVRKPKG